MDIASHIIISALLWLPVWFISENWLFATLFFLAGWLIDADHYLFYVLETGNFYIDEAYHYFNDSCRTNTLLLFHSMEVICFIWVLGLIINNIYILAVAGGFTIHLISDAINDKRYYGGVRRMSLA